MSGLDKNKIGYHFHDYKKEGIGKEKLSNWCDEAGWETILNKRSTTWRELPPEEQQKISSKSAAIKLMQAQNSIIKRPVLETGNGLLVGFSEATWQSLKLK